MGCLKLKYYSELTFAKSCKSVRKDYMYGFNGKEKDNEIKGTGNSLDFGARVYDSRLGRWLSLDPLQAKYPNLSAYNFVANSPLQAVDPDGKIIIFVNGLMLDHAMASHDIKFLPGLPNTPSNSSNMPYPTYEQSAYGPRYQGEAFEYWGKDNEMVSSFDQALGDKNNYFVNGSDHTWSQASDRYAAGMKSGQEFVQKIVSGEIKLSKDETIKLIGHSQGAAHAAGMAAALQQAKTEGKITNNIEQIIYLAPHQPTEITTPVNIPSTQYSRKSDLVSSKGIGKLTAVSGGSHFGPIKGIGKFIKMPDMSGKGNGIGATRGGHNVDTYNQVFDLKEGQKPAKKTPASK
jgi:RHS repeat-associated protein